MSARNSNPSYGSSTARRVSTRFNMPPPAVAGQAGYVPAQVAQYQQAIAAMAAPVVRDPLVATSPPWPAIRQGRNIIGAAIDQATGQPRKNPRTGKDAIGLLNPIDGPREREYILSHTKRGVELRRQFADLYAPFAAVLPPLGVARVRGAPGRRTPLIGGYAVTFYDPVSSFPDANGNIQGTVVTFGSSNYNRLLPVWASNPQIAQALIANLAAVNQPLAQIVNNDIANGRIGRYIDNPKPTKSGRPGNKIKVGGQTYNELLTTNYAQQVANANSISEQDLLIARANNKNYRAQARAAQASLPQVYIANPENGKNTAIQVGGPTFNALLHGPYEQEVRNRAMQLGYRAEQLDQFKASGIQRSNSTRARASTGRASAGRPAGRPAAPRQFQMAPQQFQQAPQQQFYQPQQQFQAPPQQQFQAPPQQQFQQQQYQPVNQLPTATRLSPLTQQSQATAVPFAQTVASVAPASVRQLPQNGFSTGLTPRTNQAATGFNGLSPNSLAAQQAQQAQNDADIF